MKSLSLSTVESFLPLMKQRGVSEVSRSPRGFIQAYRHAGGSIARMDPEWQNKRENFIKRHMAQVQMRGEALFEDDGEPTRRHLALIAWAYSPKASRLKKNPERSNPATASRSTLRKYLVDKFNRLIGDAPRGSFPQPIKLVLDEKTALAGRTEKRACAAADVDESGAGTVYLHPKVLTFDQEHQYGLLMHELAHVHFIQHGNEEHTEREADELAEKFWGTTINYDDDDIQTIGPGTHPRPARLDR